eukprot:scaffold143059_cov31-Tisochrysis_lutea.AAC.1
MASVRHPQTYLRSVIPRNETHTPNNAVTASGVDAQVEVHRSSVAPLSRPAPVSGFLKEWLGWRRCRKKGK